ncbi:NODAL-like protein [Mya arenaria]|uniref:NODAL-like protein n=1 Tax=Mya arenaria TaxID=6604 RepID=A0ABY7DIN2_MYAAR|nr:nodal homolog 4-A-like [Mya arenaria]WAQ96471.1 NODAL-like protein [Mya arenaria]
MCRLFKAIVLCSVLELTAVLGFVLNENANVNIGTESLLETLRNIRDNEELAIKPEDLRAHIVQQTHAQTDIHSPSVGFMIGVFEQLLQGDKMATVLGHTDAHTTHRLHQADTVRSFSTIRLEDESVGFNIPPLPNHETIRLMELRFLGNGFTEKRRRMTLRVRKNNKLIHKYKMFMKRGKSKFVLPESAASIVEDYKGNMSVKLVIQNLRDMANLEPILVIYSNDNGLMKSAMKSLTQNSNDDTKLNTASSTHRRYRRSSSRQEKKRRRKPWQGKVDNAEVCKLNDFKVNFDLIGWGPWIIHPKKFNARACYGQCPEPMGSEYTPNNHVMLQTLMRLKRPLAAPAPCCVATKMRPLSMLYLEYDDVVVRHHEDMIAAECGCR